MAFCYSLVFLVPLICIAYADNESVALAAVSVPGTGFRRMDYGPVLTIPYSDPEESSSIAPASAPSIQSPGMENEPIKGVRPPDIVSRSVQPSPLPEEGVFDVSLYGAISNQGKDSTKAFMDAWDAACRYTGNSTFYIPEGTFFLGPISLTGPCYNNQSPLVKIKGSLVAPASLKEFNDSWIIFKQLNRFVVDGGGVDISTLDAQGAIEAWKQVSCYKSAECKLLITSLKFMDISHGTIRNISLLNGKGFHVGFHQTDNMIVENIKITAPWNSPNTDGIHVSNSVNISITSSVVGVGDDCVSIGPGSFNISISNVHCGPGHGISVGSLGKHANEENVEGITVENCTINGTDNGIRVKTWPGSPPSSASNMNFTDILMINVSNPIVIDQQYCPSDKCDISKPSLVKLSNIYFKNITGTYNTKRAVTMRCSSSVPCENVKLIDIKLNNTTPNTPR